MVGSSSELASCWSISGNVSQIGVLVGRLFVFAFAAMTGALFFGAVVFLRVVASGKSNMCV